MKRVRVVEFSEIFNFADKNYDIGWNACNDLFFNDHIQYKSVTDIYPEELLFYVSFYKSVKRKAADYTKEEVSKMSNSDKSNIILSAFFDSKNIKTGKVMVDCR